MIHRFHEQVFQRMPPERKARKLAVMKALAKSVKTKNKENEDPLNNMALPYFTHSTPMKNPQITDLDEIESETDADTELTDTEVCGVEEDSWSEMDEPKLVISKIYDLRDGPNSKTGDDTGEDGGTVLPLKELDESSKHWRSLEVLHETAEYEFCRSLEESKLFRVISSTRRKTIVMVGDEEVEQVSTLGYLGSESSNGKRSAFREEPFLWKPLSRIEETTDVFVSTSSLLEEIEADLPSPYSLAKPLNHTFHTLTSYRTQTRLARMDSNLTCPENLKQRESLEVGLTSRKVDQLEIEATVQKALAEQAEKALVLSKANKFFGVEHIESEKALLLANLRRTAVLQEAKKLRLLGEVFEKEDFGQITISDIYFDVDDPVDNCPGKYICTVTEREHVQSTSVIDEVVDGKLHFKEPLKFQNLNKDFVIYIDLFKLVFKEPKKALLTSALVKKLRKATSVNLNRSLTTSDYGCCGFVCVSQCELRLQNITDREDDKCVLQNYLTGALQHPATGSSVGLIFKTDVHIKTKQCGFLNAFQQTWHRRWFSHSDYFLESWLYPEDQESDKPSVDSIYLPNCSSVEPVGLEVCVRPHSFIITMKDNNRELLFSANSHRDMLAWVNHLNLILEQIRLWKPNV